jgi:anti-anti-sigma factor
MFSHDSPFSATSLYEHSSLLLRLTGELDAATAPMLGTVVNDLVKPGLSDVIVDVGGLRFVDVVGLRSLVEACQASAAVGATFRLCGVDGFTRRLIQLANHPVLVDAIADKPNMSAA